ncbi:oxidoreductase [Vibrio sp. 10N.286.49.C2]|uniref:FAD-dependent oxidoreductase n=1 Tax=unclassified Vibrio TaxID=2614977 RepID=UPI000C839097|nr:MULTISPECIES: FAD-dependent oxidoreductase [unclassified Vibrio]PMH34764.1 oxidoreductase [Vibrio sp. 10N.286.49.C2]PMH51447.1 oxidoreductase [Vibrio sp. 10N.286.49.B1]PMH79357.1 oxidoreductase [Vibrio sp. 10N.286.48.B7]
MNSVYAQAASGKSVAIIGGGVAGATVALYLAKQGVEVTLFEKNVTLVSGPPICHLHAGGNLYRELSHQHCIDLLEQSIAFVRFFPQTINRRPTVIAVPKNDQGIPDALLPRLELLKNTYKTLVELDPNNEVLGQPEDYYRCVERSDLETLALAESVSKPTSVDEWLIPFAKNTDLDKLKYPVYVVQEYGLSLFRVAATIELAAELLPNLTVCTGVKVERVTSLEQGVSIEYGDSSCGEFDYLINACGFRTGLIDDQLNYSRQRMVEFKAAYITHWQASSHEKWPEVIFHGQRGTPQGMAQLTPYPDGYFQLHGMTSDITLFEDGLVHSSENSAQPCLPQYLMNKVDNGWSFDMQNQRSLSAISHLSQYVPSFINATPAGKPLFGAQQIPGTDPSLRTADVSFEGECYARLEIVKASSALQAGKKIAAQWFNTALRGDVFLTNDFELNIVEQKARELAVSRGYPESLAKAY